MRRVVHYTTDTRGVHVNPNILGGIPCFDATRVHVESLFQHFVQDYTMDGFLEQLPTVDREDALEVLRHASELVVAAARATKQ